MAKKMFTGAAAKMLQEAQELYGLGIKSASAAPQAFQWANETEMMLYALKHGDAKLVKVKDDAQEEFPEVIELKCVNTRNKIIGVLPNGEEIALIRYASASSPAKEYSTVWRVSKFDARYIVVSAEGKGCGCKCGCGCGCATQCDKFDDIQLIQEDEGFTLRSVESDGAEE